MSTWVIPLIIAVCCGLHGNAVPFHARSESEVMDYDDDSSDSSQNNVLQPRSSLLDSVQETFQKYRQHLHSQTNLNINNNGDKKKIQPFWFNLQTTKKPSSSIQDDKKDKYQKIHLNQKHSDRVPKVQKKNKIYQLESMKDEYQTEHLDTKKKVNENIESDEYPDRDEHYDHYDDDDSKEFDNTPHIDNVVEDLIDDVTQNQTFEDLVNEVDISEECTNGPPEENQHYTQSFNHNSSKELDEVFRIDAEPTVKRTNSMYDNENITLCWIETITIKEDKNTNPPKRQVSREFAISFENSAPIPDEYLDCPRIEGEILPGNPDALKKTSFDEVIEKDTKMSKAVNLTSERYEGNLFITEHKLIRCSTGSVVTKDVHERLDDSKNPKRRVEIKVGPSRRRFKNSNNNKPTGSERPSSIQSTTTKTTTVPTNPVLIPTKKTPFCENGTDCKAEGSSEKDSFTGISKPDNSSESESNDLLATGYAKNHDNSTIIGDDSTTNVPDSSNELETTESCSDEVSSKEHVDSEHLSQDTSECKDSNGDCSQQDTSELSKEKNVSCTGNTCYGIANSSAEILTIADSEKVLTTTPSNLIVTSVSTVDTETSTIPTPIATTMNSSEETDQNSTNGSEMDSSDDLSTMIPTTNTNDRAISLESVTETGFIDHENTTTLNGMNGTDKDAIAVTEDDPQQNQRNNEEIINSLSKQDVSVNSSENYHKSLECLGSDCSNSIDHESSELEKIVDAECDENSSCDPKELRELESFESNESSLGVTESESGRKLEVPVTTNSPEFPEEENSTKSMENLLTANGVTAITALPSMTMAPTVDKQSKPRLALKIKVLLEHIDENKEKKPLIQLEKQLVLRENPNDQGNQSLLAKIQALHDSPNDIQSIKNLLNCSALENFTDISFEVNDKLNQNSNDSETMRLLSEEELNDKEETEHHIIEKRTINLGLQAKKNISIKSEAIKKCLPEIQHDINSGLNEILLKLMSNTNVTANTTIDKKEDKVSSSTVKNTTVGNNTTTLISRSKRNTENYEDNLHIHKWSKERIKKSVDGGELRSLTEFIIIPDNQE